jgi:hypothetical protein
LAAAWTATFDVSGCVQPRLGAALWPGDFDHPSLYDTEPLRQTQPELIDFDLLDDGPMQLSVGAIDVPSGNFSCFDHRRQRIGAEHSMASDAMQPRFPAVTMDGRTYWDGGLVSNTRCGTWWTRSPAAPRLSSQSTCSTPAAPCRAAWRWWPIARRTSSSLAARGR